LTKADISLENLYEKTGSIYKLVTLAAKRAQEISAGAIRLTDAKSENASLLALYEIGEEKVSFKMLKDKK